MKYTNSAEMELYVHQAELIISRTGYSTIMDLKKMKKKAVLIPTPGQYEQLYLAEQLKTDSHFLILTEQEFESSEAL